MVELRREELDGPVARALIGALDAELQGLYPEPGANHFRLEAEEVAPGRGAFLVAYAGADPVGCGAVRRLDGDAAEIKRMYVADRARGRGVGRRLLAALEHEARRLGASRIVLETGARQSAALRLYERAGYVPVAASGEYVDSPLSVCLAKVLGTP